jgi:hypothetical protein
MDKTSNEPWLEDEDIVEELPDDQDTSPKMENDVGSSCC